MIMSGERQNHLHITQRTDLIYQRFYLIKRLQYPMNMLLDYHIKPQLFNRMNFSFFSHSEVQSIVTELKHSLCLKPMHTLWQKFTSYQYLFDPLFTDEFIRLICSLYLIQNTESIRLFSSRDQQLYFLDTIIDLRSHQIPTPPVKVKPQMEATTNHIAQRYFVLKRLHKAMDFLANVHIQDKSPFLKKITRTSRIDYTDDIRDDIKQFNHDRIKNCLRSLCHEKNLKPFLLVCTECKQYRYATDDTFLQEMLMSMFLIYKSLLFKNLSESTEQMVLTEMNQVLEVYENLDRLSLDEILEAIDVATDTLITIQNMQIGSYMKHFGWLPGVVLCTVLGMQVLHYLHII